MQETEIKEARATLKFARISARKVKIVADLIRGKDVQEALAIVKFTNSIGLLLFGCFFGL